MDTSKNNSVPSEGKRSHEDYGDLPFKRHRNEEPGTDEPSTSGMASYNVNVSSSKETLRQLTCQDDHSSEESSNEENNDEELEQMEPSTSGLKSKFYNVESSAPKKTLHGLTYQLRLLMLFVQRIPDGQDFFLSTEMHEAGLFDDIVLQYWEDGIWKYRFLQAKHKIDDQYKIGIRDLFNKKPQSNNKSKLSKNTGEDKPYLLKKYFKSYCNIVKNIEFENANLEEFLICTNVGFAEKALTYFEYAEENDDDDDDEDDDPILLNFEEINAKSSNPIKYRLRQENISDLQDEFEINSDNENCFWDFVEKFRFLVNYEDDQLNENIQNCLKKHLKIENVNLAVAYLQKRVLKWFESYKCQKSKYLHIKNKNEFLKSLKNNIDSLLVAGYSTFYFEELKSCEVKFKNVLPLREFLDKTGKIMFITTATPKLSVIKLSQVFDELKLKQDEFILADANKLRGNNKIFTTFLNGPSYKWLVIECHHNDIKFSKKMLDKISKMDEKKRIVLIGWKDKVLDFITNWRLETVPFEDENNLFVDLTIASQEEILGKAVIFQEEEIILNQLIDVESGRTIIDQQTSEKLVTETFKIGNDDAFKSDFLLEDCYIQRILFQRKLKLDILKNKEVLESCLFIISGIDRDQLEDMNLNSEWIYVWDDDKTFTNGIILSGRIESEDIFNKLWKNNTKNVCWLRYINGNFLIINICNETDILYKHNICLDEDDLNEEQILEKKIIILADGPGCGKSIFMTSAARHLRQIMSNVWVLRINLSSHAYKQGQTQDIKTLEDIKFEHTETNKAIEFVANLLFPQKYQNQQFVRELFSHSLDPLNKNMKFPKIILLFDGFDEISPTFKKDTLTLLEALRKTNVAQMWITTRNHEQFSLEETLDSSSFFLNPLHIMEKMDFLQKLWNYDLLNFNNIEPKLDSEEVETYLKEIADNICKCNNVRRERRFWKVREHFTMSRFSKVQLERRNIDLLFVAEYLIKSFECSYEDNISEFTGNPLQLKMIAEIMFIKKFSLLDKLDMCSQYEEFINYKWRIFRDHKDAAGKSVAGRRFFERHLKDLTTDHQEIAFKILFRPHDIEEFMEGCDKIELSRGGLLVIHDGRLEFVHRSFAEYFVSQYFAENFENEDIQKIVFSEVLVKENYSLIRKFLNRNTTFLNKLGSKTERMNEIIRINISDPKILYQMLQEDLYNLFVKFLENLPVDCAKNAILFSGNVDGKTVLHRICGCKEDGQIVENILKTVKYSVSFETLIKLLFKTDNQQRTALHCIDFQQTSIAKQKLMFFKLNCSSEEFNTLLLQIDAMGLNILDMACRYQLDITSLLEVTEENRNAISKNLLKIDNFVDKNNTIFWRNNLSMFNPLINFVKSICKPEEIEGFIAIKNDSGNLLHHMFYYGKKENLIFFLNVFKNYKKVVKNLLLDIDADGQSPLHYSGRNFFDMLKTLLNFVKLNYDREMFHTILFHRNCYGATVLHVAVTNFKKIDKRNLLTPLLTYLFTLVGDNKEIFHDLLLAKDCKGRTVLHYTSDKLFLREELLDFVQEFCSANFLLELQDMDDYNSIFH